MITFKHSGSFMNLEGFAQGVKRLKLESVLRRYGEEGVRLLSEATPKDTGETAMSWSFRIEVTSEKTSIIWSNSSRAGNAPVVLLLQYGHGTGSGAYVEGIDFINPVMQPLFNKIGDNLWKEVTRL